MAGFESDGRLMPWDQVFSKFKHGTLHSGSKSGPKVKSRKQAIAIAMSEKRAGEAGKKEYQSKGKRSRRLARKIL